MSTEQPDAEALAQLAKIGEQIRRLRKAKGLSQEGLAERVGCHSQTISNRERGTAGPFDILDAMKFADALETTVDQVLARSGTPTEIPLSRDGTVLFVNPAVIEALKRIGKKGGLEAARKHFAAGFGWGVAIEPDALQVTEEQFESTERQVRDLTKNISLDVMLDWVRQFAGKKEG